MVNNPPNNYQLEEKYIEESQKIYNLRLEIPSLV